MTSQVQTYTCVLGPNHMRRTYLKSSKFRVTTMHVKVIKIQSCDCNRVVLKVLSPVYDHVIVLQKY